VASPDVVIIGAGIIGTAVAYRLACATKLRTLVIERGSPGCEASNAAAGVLAVASGQARQGALLNLRRESARLFPALVAALEDETGIDVGYCRNGFLSLAFSDTEAEDLVALLEHRKQQGFPCELLSAVEALSLEPSVNPAISAAAFFAEDNSIESDRLVTALVVAAQRRGVRFLFDTAVQSMRADSESVTLQLKHDKMEAALVIVAAGAWSGELLATCGVKAPLRPARGEMAAVRPLGWRVRHTLAAQGGYLVPRRSGEVFVGSTMAFVGFDKLVTEAGVATLLHRGAMLLPALPRSTLVRTWAGLRSCPTIRRPIIAPLPGLPKVILATGHHRNGILLAPITAPLVTDLVTGSQPAVPLRPFSFRRH
jgi:glycine oxidase